MGRTLSPSGGASRGRSFGDRDRKPSARPGARFAKPGLRSSSTTPRKKITLSGEGLSPSPVRRSSAGGRPSSGRPSPMGRPPRRDGPPSRSPRDRDSRFGDRDRKPSFGRDTRSPRPAPRSSNAGPRKKLSLSESSEGKTSRAPLSTGKLPIRIKTVRKAVVPERPNEKETVRLNRFIASAGIAARRKADELITRGKVTVNGKIVKELGVQVNPNTDLVTVDGNTISMKTRHVYLLLNKPKDAISTVKDETDRNTVMNYVNTRERVYPVGRLDRNTTGVLLLTNDGDLTARLTHPKYQIEREYHVTLDKPLKKEDAQKIATGGVDLGEGEISSALHLAFAHNDPKDVYVVIREGKYREVRRLFEAFHYDVRKLDRTTFAGITHSGMKRGESRVLTPREVRALKGLVGLDVREKWE